MADTGCGFLDPCLLFSPVTAGSNLEVTCRGTCMSTRNHTTEDVAIVLGRAFDEALSDRRGIERYGSVILPMDEAL
jgi:imidazoleglycerol-phosphate dehydratase